MWSARQRKVLLHCACHECDSIRHSLRQFGPSRGHILVGEGSSFACLGLQLQLSALCAKGCFACNEHRRFTARPEDGRSHTEFHHARYDLERSDTSSRSVGTIGLIPSAGILRENALVVTFATGSTIGASGYWLLVQLFWFRSRRQTSWLGAVLLCAVPTLLVPCILHMFDGYDGGVSRFDAGVISAMLTIGWWLAFSTSLYWSEMSGHTAKISASCDLSVRL